MVGDGFVVLVADLVGHLAGVDKVFHTALDGLGALGNLLDELQVAL